MSRRQDILAAAHAEMPARVPWTIYPGMLPRGEAERLLRNEGLCFAYSVPPTSPQIYEWGPNVEVRERRVVERGQTLRRITYHTPVGDLTEVRQTQYAAGMAGMVVDWKAEFMVKRPADYEVLEYMLRDQVIRTDDAAIAQLQREVGDDGVVICKLAKVPFQLLWIEYTGMERLVLDLADDPSPVERVMQAMLERDRKLWALMAHSPVDLVHCSDNISGDMVSPRYWDKYFAPYYQALTEAIPPAQKPLLVHIDGLLRSLAKRIQALPAGVIVEAMNPPPTGDLSVAEARAIWGDRPIWINFPSTAHLFAPDEIEALTREILRQAAPGNGFIVGVTENIPGECWVDSMAAIGRAMNAYGKCPIAAVNG